MVVAGRVRCVKTPGRARECVLGPRLFVVRGLSENNFFVPGRRCRCTPYASCSKSSGIACLRPCGRRRAALPRLLSGVGRLLWCCAHTHQHPRSTLHLGRVAFFWRWQCPKSHADIFISAKVKGQPPFFFLRAYAHHACPAACSFTAGIAPMHRTRNGWPQQARDRNSACAIAFILAVHSEITYACACQPVSLSSPSRFRGP